jgi:hypothetical protein
MYCVFSFKSRSETMRFYSAAQAYVPCSIISTPRFIGLGCGLSVKADYKYYQSLVSAYNSSRYNTFLGAYSVDNGTVRRLLG